MKRLYIILPFLLQKVAYVIFYCLYKIFGRIVVEGRGNLEKEKGPFIFASNHTHELDATLFPLILPLWSRHSPFFFVSASKDRYKTFGWRGFVYGGKFFNALGAYAVFSGQHNYAYALQTHEEILKHGYSMCIFPEGKRTPDGHLGPARGGLGYLAYASGAKVVPVAIQGFYKLNLRDFFLCRCRIRLIVGEPFLPQIDTADKENFQRVGEEVIGKIKGMLDVNS